MEDQASGELATLGWVAWFNHHRLLEPLGYLPPAEFEANLHDNALVRPPPSDLSQRAFAIRGAVQSCDTHLSSSPHLKWRRSPLLPFTASPHVRPSVAHFIVLGQIPITATRVSTEVRLGPEPGGRKSLQQYLFKLGQ